MTFTPTEEQLSILSAVTETPANLLIEALAGAAKTSTLILIAEALPRTPILAVAFNRKIATEMQARLPANCKAQTLNSLGHRAWGDFLSSRGIRRLNLSFSKMGDLLREEISRLPQAKQSPLWDNYRDLLSALGWAKTSGHLPDPFAEAHRVTPFLSDDELIARSEIIFTREEWAILLTCLERSADLALQGTIDFDDQILFPAFFRVSFPSFPLVLVDEAQDLSLLNHVLLTKLAKTRIIAVGDSFQAIYAFRGADESSMASLRQMFKMETYHLTTTFRCASSIVEHVRWRAPLIRAWDQNPYSPGEIHHPLSWSAKDIPSGAAILCRNNAPLLSCAIYLLRNGKYPKLWGNDIAAGLLKTLDKLGPSATKREDALHLLSQWEEEQSRKLRTESAKRALSDRASCIRIFLLETETLGEALAFGKEVFEMQGPIDLATVHKAKGAEWEQVFILEPHLFGEEGQERNLRYVAATRAKRSLSYITAEGRDEG